MADDELPVALYDFLYKDSDRINSYYAQIFHGRLSSVEQTDAERRSFDRGGRAGLPVASGDLKFVSEVQTSSKSVLDPHDMATTDILAYLRAANHLSSDLPAAAHGSLVLVQGTLVFVDRSILELAIASLDVLIQDEARKPKAQQDRSKINSLRMITKVLPNIAIPSAFLLQLDDGQQVAGTIKDAGMQEPISTYYFKYGTSGIADVLLIGIKEVPSRPPALPNTQLIGAGQQAAQALSDMLFPPTAIRVTPIALFRKLFQEE